MNQTARIYLDLLQRIHRYRQRKKRRQAGSGFIVSLAIAGVLITAATGLETLFRFDLTSRLIVILTVMLLTSGAALWFFLKPLGSLLFKKGSPDEVILALEIGSFFPQLRDRLANSLQIYRDKFNKNKPVLIGAVLQAAAKDCENLNFAAAANPSRLAGTLRQKGIILLFLLLVWVMAAENMQQGFIRLIHPRIEYQKPLNFSLTIAPGDTTVIAGSRVLVKTEIKGKKPAFLKLQVRKEGEDFKKINLLPQLVYPLNRIKKKVFYKITAPDYESRLYVIEVRFLPQVNSLQVRVNPPNYTRLKSYSLPADQGSCFVPRHTIITLQLKFNKCLHKAEVVFDSGRHLACKLYEKQGLVSFKVDQEDSFHFALLDSCGLGNINPITYRIRTRADLPPAARIIKPAMDRDLSETMKVNFDLEADDDYGLSQFHLYWQLSRSQAGLEDGPTDSIAVSGRLDEPLQAAFSFEWDLSQLGLLPEDVVTCWFGVRDNDQFAGFKAGLSRSIKIRFPSIGEILAEAAEMQTDQQNSLGSLQEQSEELQEMLDEIADKIKTGRQLPWEESQKARQIVQQQKDKLATLEDLAADLAKLAARLGDNELLSQATRDKYEELQQLYQEIASPDLDRAMEKFNKMLDNLNPAAIQEMQNAEEKLIQSLDRTIELLKQVQTAQQMDALINQVRKMEKAQAEVNSRLADSAEDKSALAGKEDQISKSSTSVEDNLSALQKKINERANMPNRILDRAAALNKAQNTKELTSSMSKDIRTGQKSQALQKGRQARTDMNALSQELEKAKKQLQNSAADENKKRATASLRRLLAISQKQESLTVESKAGRISLQRAAREQMSLYKAVQNESDSLLALARQSFSFHPDVSRSLGEALGNMKSALQTLGQNNRPASGNQIRALGAVNRAALGLQKTMDKMNSSGQQGGAALDRMLSDFGEMTEQQMGLNRATRDMLGKGGLTMQQQAEMSRLGGQQAALRDQLRKSLSAYETGAELRGRLDKLTEEMAETARLMKEDGTNREIIERQQKIISRLLDATLALRERDLSRKRQAVSGEDFKRSSPGALHLNYENIKKQLQQDMLRLAKEGYSEDYIELIRKYYYALMARKVEAGGKN